MVSGSLCAVRGCRSSKRRNEDNISFFHLPVDDERRKKWAELIGRCDLAKPKTKIKTHFVCSLHFDPSVITYTPKLRPNALPSLLLPSGVVTGNPEPGPSTSNSTINENKKEILTQIKNSTDIGDERNRLFDSTDSANGSEYLSDSEYQSKRKRKEIQEILVVETQSSTGNGRTECEMYAVLLLHKLMKLEEDDRLILMNKIDNVVFETTMESYAKRKLKQNSSDQILCYNTESSSHHEVRSSSYLQESPPQLRTENNIFLPATSSSYSPSIVSNNSQFISLTENIEIKQEP